jgi:glycosyltransferase involved in cell wall biosynthesis
MRAVATLPDTHLLVAGDGRQLSKCVELAQQLGIAERVTFAGRIPHEDLQRYYWAADQFILASREHVDSRTGLRDVETMGRVLCEAHAAGVPAIASDSGGIPSIIDHGRNGLLFEPDNLDALVHNIRQLREDKNLSRTVISEGFRDAAERWDWSIICRSHEQIFRAVHRGNGLSSAMPQIVAAS